MFRSPESFAFLLAWASIASAQTEWKPKTHKSTNSLLSVVHAGKEWVAVGIHGVVLTSQDGNAWLDASTEATKHVGFLAVAWSGKSLVAGGYGDRSPNFAKGMLMASEDGKTWEEGAVTPATVRAVTWGRDRFVAVGDGGGLHTSADGLKWTSHDPLPRGYLSGIAWNGSQFMTVGYGGAILVSSDAEKWSEKGSPTKSVYSSAAWTGKRWIVVGEGGIALFSKDGETWTQGKTGVKNWLKSVAWTGGGLVAVGDSGTILVSQDGSEWQAQQSGTRQNLYAVAVHDNTIIAVGESNTILASTVDVTTLRGPSGVRKSRAGDICRFQRSGMVVQGDGGHRGRIWAYSVRGIRYPEVPAEPAALP